MTLFDATRHLHHACEEHPVGTRMSNGSCTPQEWADWLWAFRELHRAVDPALPAHMVREQVLTADLSVLPRANPSHAARCFALSLTDMEITGAAYVLHGAHRSGGRVMAPKMAKRGFPTLHTCYREPDAVKAWLDSVRSEVSAAKQASDTFNCLLEVMGEIEERA